MKDFKQTVLAAVATAIALCVTTSTLAADGGDLYGTIKVKPPVPINAEPFDLTQVRVLEDDLFTPAAELNKEYLKAMEPNRLLWPFHERAGLPVLGARYGGWEARGVVGQIAGHYLSGCAQMYAQTGDEEFKKRLDYMIEQIAVAQKKHGNGYAGTVETRIFDEVFAGKIEASGFGLNGGWVPWYVIHKTFAGLIDAYIYTGNEQALEIACKFADWTKRGADKLTDEQFQQMLRCEYGGMAESMANLYGLTGNKDYLALAKRFDHKAIFEPLAKGEDKLGGIHGNTTIPKMIGAIRVYELTGDKRYFNIASYFWNQVVKQHSFVLGGHGRDENFQAPDTEAAHLTAFTNETCGTYNMLKLTRHLFTLNPTAELMDYYERALYNHILATQDPKSGQTTYFYPLKPGHFKIYSTPEHSFWCCNGTTCENHSKYGETIYFHKDDTLWVNLFIPSQLTWKDRGLTIRQETEFPVKDTSKLTIKAEKPVELAVKIRVPYWATQGVEVRVNGELQKVEAKQQSYVTVDRTWKDGDRIDVKLPMKVHMHRSMDDPNTVALMYGPIVLAGELGREGMPETLYHAHQKKHGNDPVPEVPVLVTDEDDPSKWVKRVSEDRLEFRTENVGRPKDVTLLPVYKIYDQRYAVYWKLKAAKE